MIFNLRKIIEFFKVVILVVIFFYFTFNVAIGLNKKLHSHCKTKVKNRENLSAPKIYSYDLNDTITILSATGDVESNYKYLYTVLNQDSLKYKLETNKNLNIGDNIPLKNITSSYLITYQYKGKIKKKPKEIQTILYIDTNKIDTTRVDTIIVDTLKIDTL
jgi:hypothetical protein